ncbi:MAG: DUF7931 domain-containing protein [Chromatiales bacterium]
MSRADGQTLGEDGENLTCSSSTDVRQLALAMAQQCRRTLDICGRQLDPHVLDSAEFAEAVRQLAIRSRYARIRLLVLQPELTHQHGHHLLRLAHELSSFIHVRVPGEDHKGLNEAMLIADETGYIHRSLSDRYDGVAHFNNRLLASELTRRFDEIWEHGEIDQHFRRLSL